MLFFKFKRKNTEMYGVLKKSSMLFGIRTVHTDNIVNDMSIVGGWNVASLSG